MLNEASLVDTIERAHTDRPYCVCGRQTVTIYRDGSIWLECEVVHEPIEGRVARLWSVVTEPGHVHMQIAEVPAPESLAA